MGKLANPTCLYCARNYRTEEEAQAKHPECYVGHNCRIKRYRLKNSSRVNAQRRDRYGKDRGIEAIEPIAPDAFWVELIVYGTKNKSVHSVALKIYQGNQLKYKMEAQHTLGLSMRELKDYVDKIMAYLESEYGIDRLARYYWLDPQDCPVCRKQKF